MFSEVVEHILQLKIFLITSGVGTLLVGLALFVLCRNFKFEGKNRKLMGFFYGLGRFDSFGMATALLKVFLFISLLIQKCNVTMELLFVYGILQVLYIVHRRTGKKLPYHLVMGIVTFGIMFLMMILSRYLREIIYDYRVFVVLIFMDIVLLLNAVGDIFRCATRIITYDEE